MCNLILSGLSNSFDFICLLNLPLRFKKAKFISDMKLLCISIMQYWATAHQGRLVLLVNECFLSCLIHVIPKVCFVYFVGFFGWGFFFGFFFFNKRQFMYLKYDLVNYIVLQLHQGFYQSGSCLSSPQPLFMFPQYYRYKTTVFIKYSV